ncbi:hypothetical protein AVEN_221332-1 [Araneus ventricosus]|uniref:Uncharacterized protein n=1 Tax=Araneus ventricosus TaxID=182803 RepID=A0A4Y2AZ84_ARAVE|nr:hypothetical protein AVEN_221332-1 [Araneus ventricosus]
MSVNSRTSKEASRRTEISAQFLRDVVDCICVMGTVLLVEFRQAINPQQRNPQLNQVQESARPQKTIGERLMVKEESAASVGTRPWTPEGRSLTLYIVFML